MDARTREILETLRPLHEARAAAYARGDVAGYMKHYASDAMIVLEGEAMSPSALERVVQPLFASGGRVLSLDLDEPQARSDATGDSVAMCYAWSEAFRAGDGSETFSRFYETNVWFRREGAWGIALANLTKLEG